MYNEGIRTFTAYGAITAHARVKIKSGTTTEPPQVELAGSGEQHIGVAEFAAATGTPVSIKLRTYPGTVEMVAADSFSKGATLYGAASGKVTDSSAGSAIGIAAEAATTDGDIVEVIPFAVLSTTAATVSVADSGGFTGTATVEAALAEIYQDLLSTKAIIPIPTQYFTSAGAALAAFSDGASAVPGYCVTAKGLGIRWNNHATPGAVGAKIILPADFNEGVDAVLNILAAKTGATVGDATKFTVAAYNNDVGAAYDADSDFGGDTDAMTGDAVAKTVQHVTLTLATADLTAYPAAVEITVKPKDGTLGTDDVIMLACWIEYKRKIRTA